MHKPPLLALCAALPLLLLTASASAHEQVEAAPASADAPPAPPLQGEAGAPLAHPDTNMQAPPPDAGPPTLGVVPPPPPPQTFTPDHRQHHWAVGAFSAGNVAMTSIQLFAGQASAPLPYASSDTITLGPIPAVGARVWLLDGASVDIALDVAVGFSTASEQRRGTPGASGDPNLPATSNPNETRAYDYVPSAVYLHVGLPIAVYQGHHYTMEFIPEVNVGYGWGRGTYQRAESGAPHNVQTDGHGINIDAGVRAGPEITFGFFDLPELVVQPTVGLLVHWDSTFAGSRMDTLSGEVLDGHWNVSSAVARLDASVSMFYYF